MARRSGFSRAVLARAPRRSTAWGIGPGGAGSTVSSGPSTAIMGSGSQSTVEGSTVVRIRGQILIQMISAATALDQMGGAVGIGIAQLPAFTAGIGSLPTPITEVDDENWLWHSFFSLEALAATPTWSSGTGQALRFDIDAKAMRKFDTDRVLYGAIEIESETGTTILHTFFDSRILVKLA